MHRQKSSSSSSSSSISSSANTQAKSNQKHSNNRQKKSTTQQSNSKQLANIFKSNQNSSNSTTNNKQLHNNNSNSSFSYEDDLDDQNTTLTMTTNNTTNQINNDNDMNSNSGNTINDDYEDVNYIETRTNTSTASTNTATIVAPSFAKTNNTEFSANNNHTNKSLHLLNKHKKDDQNNELFDPSNSLSSSPAKKSRVSSSKNNSDFSMNSNYPHQAMTSPNPNNSNIFIPPTLKSSINTDNTNNSNNNSSNNNNNTASIIAETEAAAHRAALATLTNNKFGTTAPYFPPGMTGPALNYQPNTAPHMQPQQANNNGNFSMEAFNNFMLANLSQQHQTNNGNKANLPPMAPPLSSLLSPMLSNDQASSQQLLKLMVNINKF